MAGGPVPEVSVKSQLKEATGGHELLSRKRAVSLEALREEARSPSLVLNCPGGHPILGIWELLISQGNVTREPCVTSREASPSLSLTIWLQP